MDIVKDALILNSYWKSKQKLQNGYLSNGFLAMLEPKKGELEVGKWPWSVMELIRRWCQTQIFFGTKHRGKNV